MELRSQNQRIIEVLGEELSRAQADSAVCLAISLYRSGDCSGGDRGDGGDCTGGGDVLNERKRNGVLPVQNCDGDISSRTCWTRGRYTDEI
ncbi:MAG: hypothetical protein V8R18_02685 [Clostridium sp.]